MEIDENYILNKKVIEKKEPFIRSLKHVHVLTLSYDILESMIKWFLQSFMAEVDCLKQLKMTIDLPFCEKEDSLTGPRKSGIVPQYTVPRCIVPQCTVSRCTVPHRDAMTLRTNPHRLRSCNDSAKLNFRNFIEARLQNLRERSLKSSVDISTKRHKKRWFNEVSREDQPSHIAGKPGSLCRKTWFTSKSTRPSKFSPFVSPKRTIVHCIEPPKTIQSDIAVEKPSIALYRRKTFWKPEFFINLTFGAILFYALHNLFIKPLLSINGGVF